MLEKGDMWRPIAPISTTSEIKTYLGKIKTTDYRYPLKFKVQTWFQAYSPEFLRK